MVRPPCCDKINIRKGSWNEEDDAQMLAFVAKQPTSNWQVGTPRKPGAQLVLNLNLNEYLHSCKIWSLCFNVCDFLVWKRIKKMWEEL